ncbi:helix-turn-helix transcriptional regulator [Clostridium sporogenes]|uniref:helix-turn-helix domain-containing protein n=1 Tax=Clostridium sporogenes TaxID=1509 RepID=UPI001C119686|nr:helix-turn-helix transcriptional regulator [Clostridium sporogenes]MBU5300473.1 helix-turn-helix transcriptional regulator [Clostridium sporogenes]
MGKIHTFKELIQKQCYDEIFESARIYVEENPDRFKGESNIVDEPEEAELSEIEIQFISVTEKPNYNLEFDVVVSAEIEVHQRMPHSYSESDGIVQWLRVCCSATLKNGLHNFKTLEVHIYNKFRTPKEGKLSEYLVPITYKEQLDDIAQDFLRRYYPKALEKPMAIPVTELAESMGLKIEYTNLSKSCTVFGQIYFSDCKTQFYYCEKRRYEPMDIKEGTIVVDPKVFFMRNVGSVNNTIIHECVHWDRHNLFFQLEKIFNPIAKAITCQVSERKKSENDGTPYEWMEWQANHLAPRILMPATTTKAKIKELIKKNKIILPNANKADIIESVIFELSEFFGVSKMSAKIRMLDLGYKEAEGVYTYVDDHYVLNYCFEQNALEKGQTYTIGIQDALFEYATNFKFRQIIDSGNYIFVDNHFCINDSKYVKFNDLGSPALTDYARQHIDECCFVFKITSRENKNYGAAYYSQCTLFRSAIANNIIDTVYDDSEHNEAINQRAIDIKDTAKDILKIRSALPHAFTDTLVAHMKRKHCTVDKLAELSLIGPKTIQRMRNDEDYSATLENVVAICIGLQLHPIFSKDLLKKAGLGFKNTEKQITYQLLIDSCYNESIHYCNEILQGNGFEPLGTEK